ncbi:MAG: helix-turn-helix domain-containing protein [Oligoflexia bacterium]|nr:helix-turn-helix domain-containing protein [Oligoflexia bacterium]
MNDPTRSVSQAMGKVVRKVRQLRRLTQAQCAAACGVGHRHFQKIEAGEVNPSLAFFQSLSNVLETRPCYFLNTDVVSSPLSRYGILCASEILDILPVAAFIATASGEILYTNKAFREFFGPEQLSSLWKLFCYKDEQEKAKEQFKAQVPSDCGARSGPFRLIGQDKRIYPAQIEWRALRSAGNREIDGTLGVIVLMVR